MANGNIPRADADAEIRILLAQAIGHLRVVSESATTLTRRRTIDLITEATRAIEAARKLAEQSNPRP
jgi:hypothetical protein